MTTLSTRTLVRVGITTLALTLAACGGGGGSDGTDAADSATAALSQAKDCDDLLASIRADAREKIRVQADELRERGWAFNAGGQPTPYATGRPSDVEPSPAPDPGPPYNSTDINRQAPGVDDATVVETDGTRLYVLHEEELLVLPAMPPESLTLGERIAIEGQPRGMFVTDGRGLVVSSVSGVDVLGGIPTCQIIGPPFPTDDFRYCSGSFVKLTLLDLRATARVAREVYVEGYYLGARRHGSEALVIVQRPWGAPPVVSDPWGSITAPTLARDEGEFRARVDAWEAAALDAIDASAVDEWLPSVRERAGGALLERRLDCADVYMPPPGHTRPGALMLVGIDLTADDEPLRDTTLLGLASEVYVDADALVLAQADWQAQRFGEASTRTAFHVFRLAGQWRAVEYRGSGFAPGTVLSPSSIDVHDDVVRVATNYIRVFDGQLVTRMHTARLERGRLEILGATEDMAPGERLESVRFIGDHVYLTTIFGEDPLVVDLARPRHPTVLGNVDIPGFSDHLQALDDHHLLTIADDNEGYVVLRIFDVSEPTAVRLVHQYGMPNMFSSSWRYAVVTLDRRNGLLALPLEDYERFSPIATLQVLAVDLSTGITPRGVVRHDPAKFVPCAPPFEWEGCLLRETMQRGLFIDDAVFTISDQEIRAQRLNDLSHTLARVILP